MNLPEKLKIGPKWLKTWASDLLDYLKENALVADEGIVLTKTPTGLGIKSPYELPVPPAEGTYVLGCKEGVPEWIKTQDCEE